MRILRHFGLSAALLFTAPVLLAVPSAQAQTTAVADKVV